MTSLLAAFVCSVVLSRVLAAAPPTDEQVAGLIGKIKAVEPPGPADARNRAAYAAYQAARAAALHDGLAEVSLAEATLAQIERVAETGALAANAEAAAVLAPRLAELAKEPGIAGARAAELRIAFFTPYVAPAAGATAEARSKSVSDWFSAVRPVLKAGITHGGALELVKAGKGAYFFGLIGSLPPSAIKEDHLVEAVEPLLVPEMSLETAGNLGNLVSRLCDPELGLEKKRRDHLLDLVAAAADGGLSRQIGPEQQRLAEAVRATSMRAKSAFARGELMGGPMPPIPFSWCSNPSLKSLSDLKGNVIVLDFWATRYDGSITRFPFQRELMARYREAGSPVSVVGVTSLQGLHIKRSLDPGAKPVRIDCRNEPEKEYGLMAEFMQEMEVTWTIAFTPDGCYNPNYGVIGIPHTTVIDPAGRVRLNELRPSTAAEYKVLADQIDALLREAGLKVPDQPMPGPPAPAAPALQPQAK